MVNFVKNENFLALRIEDLASLQTTKDKDSHSLLFHIVRKTIQSELDFSGFSGSLTEGLAAMTRLTIWRKTGLIKFEEQETKKLWPNQVFQKLNPCVVARFDLGAIEAGLRHMENTCRFLHSTNTADSGRPEYCSFFHFLPFLSFWTTFTNFDACLVNP